MKFVLLHETRNDDGIKAFFVDVWELYVKVSVLIVSLEWGEGSFGQYADNAQSIPHGTYANTECGV